MKELKEVTRDECVISIVGVRGGYKAMVECTLEMHTEEEELKRAQDDGRCRQGGNLGFLGSKTW